MNKLTIEIDDISGDRIYDWVQGWNEPRGDYLIMAEYEVMTSRLRLRGWTGERAKEVYDIMAPAFKQVVATEKDSRATEAAQLSLTE